MSENSDGLYHHHSLSRAHQKLQTHSWLFTFTSHTLQISKFFLNRSHHFPYPLFPITYIWVFFLFGIVITGFLQIVPHRLQQFPFWNTNLTMKKKPFAKTLQWLPIADSLKIKCLKISHRDFLGGPVAKKTLCSECRKLGFTSWSVELDPTCHSWHSQINLKEKKKKDFLQSGRRLPFLTQLLSFFQRHRLKTWWVTASLRHVKVFHDPIMLRKIIQNLGIRLLIK